MSKWNLKNFNIKKVKPIFRCCPKCGSKRVEAISIDDGMSLKRYGDRVFNFKNITVKCNDCEEDFLPGYLLDFSLLQGMEAVPIDIRTEGDKEYIKRLRKSVASNGYFKYLQRINNSKE